MAMELRQLRYFLAVAEEGHITRAAERLGIQQPPLSRQIKELERELQVRLFNRKARGVEMTDAGEALLAEARSIFSHVDGAVARTQRASRGEQGQICVGLTSAAIFHPLVPQIIREFRAAFPQVSLILEDGGPFELVSQIEKGGVDAAFIRTPAANSETVGLTHLLDEPMVAVLPGDFKHAKGRNTGRSSVRLKDLSREPYIDYGRPRGSWPWLRFAIYEACHAAGFSPRVSQVAPEMVAAANLVAAGLGFTIVPQSLRHMNIKGVVYCDLTGVPQPKAPLNLATRQNDASGAVRNFVSLAKRAVRIVRGP
jgi:DNA-binding transcriptional LysR family regulator